MALGFCFGLGSCIIAVGSAFLPLGYYALLGVGSMSDIQIVVATRLGMYFEGHGHVDFVTLGLSKLVGGCCSAMVGKVSLFQLLDEVSFVEGCREEEWGGAGGFS